MHVRNMGDRSGCKTSDGVGYLLNSTPHIIYNFKPDKGHKGEKNR